MRQFRPSKPSPPAERLFPVARPAPSPARWGFLVGAFCLALLSLGPVFDTNDDPAMIGLIAGTDWGKPFDAAYLGSPLSAALRTLYAASPAVPWYAVFFASCNVLSAVLFGSLIASCGLRPSVRRATTAGLMIGASYLMLRVNFMAASLSLFLAAAAWLWKLQIERHPARWRQGWLGAAMGLAYLMRPSALPLMVFYALPSVLVAGGRDNRRRLLVVGAAAGSLALLTIAGEFRRYAEPAARALAASNIARSLIVDVPRDPAPAALAAAGWSRSDYDMAVRFGMYDERLYSLERIRSFLAASGKTSGVAAYVRTSRAFLLGRFHVVCLVAALCAVWLIRAETAGAAAAARPPSGATRALVWVWLGGGTLFLVATRFPPRVFVPVYLYLAALASLVPPHAVVRPARPPSGTGRFAASAVLGGLLCVALAFWLVDARAGKARLAIDRRELIAGLGSLPPDAILVPVGLLFEAQYTAAFTPARRLSGTRVAPTGWLAATPAVSEFLRGAGYASGEEFMRSLTVDPRVVFVVRRSSLAKAEWLVERLVERYSPGETRVIVPLAALEPATTYQFFQVKGAESEPSGS